MYYVTKRHSLLDEINEMHNDLLGSLFSRNKEDVCRCPNAYIQEKDNAFILELEMPGIEKELININVKDNELTISGSKLIEEKSGKMKTVFERTFSIINSKVDTENIKASFINGLLSLTIAKKKEAQPKQITVD